MRQDRSEAVALSGEGSPTAHRGLFYARPSSVSPGRGSTNDVLSSSAIEELLSQAFVQGDQDAWAELQQGLEETVREWLYAHPSKDAACRCKSEEHYVALAFEQFRQAAIERSMTFNTLAEALGYLCATLNGVILETLRVFTRPSPVSLTEPEESGEPNEEDHPMSLEGWNRLQARLSSERERRLAYLLYHCGLSPNEIVRYCRNLARPSGHIPVLSIGLKTGWKHEFLNLNSRLNCPRNCFYTRTMNREIILACGMCLELPREMEAKDVLSYCDPGGFIAHLAVEIDSTQFAGYPVASASAVSISSARSPVGILLLRTRGLGRAAQARERGTGVQCGAGSTISPEEIDPST